MTSSARFWSRKAKTPVVPGRGGLPEPDHTRYPVGGESTDRGANQVRLLRYWGLRPSAQLLEIGCGVGRLAYELAPYLDPDGRYCGFDINPKLIRWLDEHYAPHLPNFRFDLVEVRNARYRPRRGVVAETVRFPYADGQFDVACAFAVYMHMQLPEIAHYLGETRRVLKADGFGVATFRTINPGETPPRTRGREWVSVGGGVHTIFPETPGRALAYDDALIRATIAGAGLAVTAKVDGRWHGNQSDSPDTPTLGADVYVLAPADSS